jgi:hypothetical protein
MLAAQITALGKFRVNELRKSFSTIVNRISTVSEACAR